MKQGKGKPELLAPAGDEESLRAAVRAGADAVYLGYKAFGARASAANFDAETLEKAVRYAHLYHVRVHVTVNTLIKQGELQDVLEALETIARCQADAVIVQDLGVARLVLERFPQLHLHASTQLALHNASGARFARDFGFDRVVLAREAGLETIREVAQTGVETEVFVHGALCAGVSGQCLFSSMAGGRSGNRGRCAQPCRQQVTLRGRTAALLSMKDLMLRDALPELVEAGACSFKIEGRLKRPEYVAVVTDSYRRAIDDFFAGRFTPGNEDEKKRLMQAFHRGGFTMGHAMGEEDAALCATERAGHGGLPVGRIARVKGNLAFVSLSDALRDGDGLQLRGAEETELRYAGHDRAAGEEATLRLREDMRVCAGDGVWRLTAMEQTAWAEKLCEKPIEIAMDATVRPGEPIAVTVSDGETEACAEGECAQLPRTRALTEEETRARLARLGDTPFTLSRLTLSIGEVFAPVSSLNAVRREALDRLESARIRRFGELGRNPRSALEPQALEREKNNPMENRLMAHSTDAALGQALLDAGATDFVFAPQDFRNDTLKRDFALLPRGARVALPPQLPDADLSRVCELLSRYAGTVAGVELGSVGQLGFAWPVPAALGDGVPICNQKALAAAFAYRPEYATLWPELRGDEQRELLWPGLPCVLKVYGRERLMLLNHCPARVAAGLKRGHGDCALCDRHAPESLEGAVLTDRKGYAFPMTRTRTGEGCVVNLYNALPTELDRYDEARKALGAGRALCFTTESREEQLEITTYFATGQPCQLEAGTAGHWLRGVE